MKRAIPHTRPIAKWLTPAAALRMLLWMSTMAGAKEPLPTPADVPLMGEMDAYLLESLWEGEGNPDGALGSISDREDYRAIVERWGLKLFGGPMVGSVTDTSARIWLRTPFEAGVAIAWAESPTLVNAARTPVRHTTTNDDLVAVFTLSGLDAMTVYHYQVFVDEHPVFGDTLPAFRTYPPKGRTESITIGFGGGARYVPENEYIWDAIDSHGLDAFLFMGDNVYHDAPRLRRRQRVHLYRRQLRPEFRRMVSSTPIYAIWDDHDFGGDDSWGGPDPVTAKTREETWKVPTWRVFRENWVNPAYGGGDGTYGVWFTFSIGDVDLFMLDGRYYRERAYGFATEKSMLGRVQKRWLKESLRASNATFKVIASGVPWAFGAKPCSYDHWGGYPSERDEILSFVQTNGIGGVILLSADRHRHDAWRVPLCTGAVFHEFESSRLTNNASDRCIHHRDRLLCYFGRGFGLLRFDFDGTAPAVTYEIWSDGNVRQGSYTLTRDRLGPTGTASGDTGAQAR